MYIYIDDKLNIHILESQSVLNKILENFPNNEKESSNLCEPFNMFDYVKEAFSLNINEHNVIENSQNEKIKSPLLQLQTTAFSNNESEFKFLREMQYCGIPYDNDDDEKAQKTRSAELNEMEEKEFLVYLLPRFYKRPKIPNPYYRSVIEVLCRYISERLQEYSNHKIDTHFLLHNQTLRAYVAFKEKEEYTISDYFNDLGIQKNSEIAEKIKNDTEFNCFYILLSNHNLREILFKNIREQNPDSTFNTFMLLNDFSWEAYKEDSKFNIPDTNCEIKWADVNEFISKIRYKFLNSQLKAHSIKCNYEEISKFTYFCVLYLKVRDQLSFNVCTCCGRHDPFKPSDYILKKDTKKAPKKDYYCKNCKNNPEFSKIKDELNRDREKYDKAIRVFKDKVKKDDPAVYEEDDVKTSFYNELIEKIRKKINNYLVKKRKITVGNVEPDDNTDYDEKYNDLTEIYEKYFTAVNFFKIITADLKKVTKKEINSWEITIFDEVIKRLRESHNIYLKDFENFEKVYAEYEENWKNQKKVPVERFLYDPKNYLIPEQREQPFD